MPLSMLTANGPRGPRRPWTRDEAIQLGRLYAAAHGVSPNANHCRAEWCLPSHKTILKLFGNMAAYSTALALDPAMKLCGCTETERCPEARTYHQRWQRGDRERTLLLVYQAHLRVAGVSPGHARWI